ncbi:MAG: sigma-70 family RNA polymerase sigma factor [Bryobacteraceae bacterium]|nr:sigma-70 family RNA polymerase sigma factor [Bryobacteraceae bacterium]
MSTEGEKITQLLEEWRLGDQSAFDRIAPAVLDHLREVARAYLTRERPGHTLQATALVNEVFLRLIDSQRVRYSSRAHFYAFAAKLMRRILVDSARSGAARKRGSSLERVALAPELAWVDAASEEMLDLDLALAELAGLDPQKVQTLEIRFFLGATSEETADLTGQSRAKVDRDIKFALSWLHRRLRGSFPVKT